MPAKLTNKLGHKSGAVFLSVCVKSVRAMARKTDLSPNSSTNISYKH